MKRSRNRVVPPIVLDKTSGVPLYRQIAREIAQAIGSGAACKHDRLPSTRMLAKMLDVSRNTALAAYDDLVADALISGRPGAGMRIEAGATPSPESYGLEHIVRASHYPAKTLALADPDGNPLYIRF